MISENILSLLRAEALTSTMDFRHAAALIHGGKIIGSARNEDRTMLMRKPISSIHAEQQVILNRLAQIGH